MKYFFRVHINVHETFNCTINVFSLDVGWSNPHAYPTEVSLSDSKR